jgi:hypothetical protein
MQWLWHIAKCWLLTITICLEVEKQFVLANVKEQWMQFTNPCCSSISN